jgi:hypothetical protein
MSFSPVMGYLGLAYPQSQGFPPRIDTIALFSTEINLPQTMKIYRKAALKDIRGLIDEKLRELETEP